MSYRKIEFNSLIKQAGQTKTEQIQFTSPVTISQLGSYFIYEFIEPQNQVMNRIEIGPKNVNIFAGPSTLNLELAQVLEITYQTPHGALHLNAHLHSLQQTLQEIAFHYTLSKNNELIGTYTIKLRLS